ncbi:proline-rich protein HaeIII subfamily 1-like isoform X3 [Gopherus evgoodei]|uniref:proline-rich protein HaeIII subfamily 1-like isoform X3 n=1 Tax=Gopherus evgoodei TaxID=1825980 RepID=UPI0011D01A55|nr:proline-rich protein HaeIII subfamily 1-like isoform X3 [Gopherus evgoodei]XP_030402784.1 proline-rich protein HaeIII subfamily 1-like isoform X3 [Gopherus evgoodei]
MDPQMDPPPSRLQPQSPTASPMEPHGPSDGPPVPHGPTARPPDPHGPSDRPSAPHGPMASPTDEALTTDPVWGPGLAPRKGEGAGNGPLPTQPRHYLTAVPVLVGIILVLVGVLTYMLCRRHQRAPPGPGSPHRDSGTGTLYYPCELG